MARRLIRLSKDGKYWAYYNGNVKPDGVVSVQVEAERLTRRRALELARWMRAETLFLVRVVRLVRVRDVRYYGLA